MSSSNRKEKKKSSLETVYIYIFTEERYTTLCTSRYILPNRGTNDVSLKFRKFPFHFNFTFLFRLFEIKIFRLSIGYDLPLIRDLEIFEYSG